MRLRDAAACVAAAAAAAQGSGSVASQMTCQEAVRCFEGTLVFFSTAASVRNERENENVFPVLLIRSSCPEQSHGNQLENW